MTLAVLNPKHKVYPLSTAVPYLYLIFYILVGPYSSRHIGWSRVRVYDSIWIAFSTAFHRNDTGCLKYRQVLNSNANNDTTVTYTLSLNANSIITIITLFYVDCIFFTCTTHTVIVESNENGTKIRKSRCWKWVKIAKQFICFFILYSTTWAGLGCRGLWYLLVCKFNTR